MVHGGIRFSSVQLLMTPAGREPSTTRGSAEPKDTSLLPSPLLGSYMEADTPAPSALGTELRWFSTSSHTMHQGIGLIPKIKCWSGPSRSLNSSPVPDVAHSMRT